MNGPFFSERGIFPSYSVTRRSLTHCARRNLRNPRTGPGTRCETVQNGHTKRVPSAEAVFSTITDQPGLQNRKSTCSGGAGSGRAAGLTAVVGRAPAAFLCAAGFRAAVRRAVVLLALVALISLPSLETRRAGFIVFSVG